jgi:predicted DNA-binding transcriptional regulator YafY
MSSDPYQEDSSEAGPSPTARALLALELLQSHPGITAAQIADKLGVSERAARRYIEILREADIPIRSIRGPYGGYRLDRGLRLPPLVFSSAEALALVMAVLDGHHDAADPTHPVGSALGKIIRALPEPVAAQAESVRRATAPVPDRGAARPDAGTTATLVQACSTHRQIRIVYRSQAGTSWSSVVEPWAVVVRHGRWYLLCQLTDRDGRTERVRAEPNLRTYRIDRVASVTLLDATFIPPPDLDPVATLERNLAIGWEFSTEVIISAPRRLAAACLPTPLGTLTAIDDRTTRLVGSTSDPQWYAEQLAQSPAPFRVVGGAELRNAVGQLAERMRASVDQSSE